MLRLNAVLQNREDLVKDFFDIFQKQSRHCTLLNFLLDKKSLALFLNEVMPFGVNTGLTSAFCTSIHQFSLLFKAQLRAYFSGKSRLDTVCRHYACLIENKKLSIPTNIISQSFKTMAKMNNQLMSTIVASFSFKYEVNILAYGGGSAESEKSIITALYESGCKKVNLYVFDPYNKAEDDSYISLTEKDVLGNSSLRFDVISARWALHHVKKQYRWKTFLACIERCDEGVVIILEDGVSWPYMSATQTKVYQLFLALLDTQINFSLRPSWFMATAPKIGNNFFIEYLENKTFDALSQSKEVHAENQLVIPVGPYMLPCQTLCLFNIRRSNEIAR